MIGLPNPYLIGGVALGLICSHGYVYFKGRGDGSASVQAKYAKATEKALRAMRRGEKAIDGLNGLYAIASNRQTEENRSISHAATILLPRPIYSMACVDADGVGLLDRARANSNLALDPGQSAGGASGASGDAPQR